MVIIIIMDNQTKKLESQHRWRDYGQSFNDYIYENVMDWPVTSIQWGSILQSNS